ncbi:DUF1080 domain-containing protein [Sinomicrobium soli]|uniref:DUF1080 domain-containing protein n=1 Tax=Sinomicrobium sp. N-1-3-6 TaxID=2219864 RepID=UPI000DCE0CF1|nr:DUF1080 domain-containing protein [Sinomicrobium sp. N-1-3-6]RAV30277.1 DUF1080 domain-containing protein [Sinomicrobium sp. N-1-3-6]
MKKTMLIMVVAAFVLGSCKNKEKSEKQVVAEAQDIGVNTGDNTLTDKEKSERWMLLFNGKSTDGWRSYNDSVLNKGWVVEDGTLKSLGKGGDIGGDIVYGNDTFENFELSLEWKIGEGGNSGVFYHVLEGEEYKAPYFNAPEYQVIDQLGFPQKLEDWQSIGADYGMYTPDYEGAVKPAGEWNSTRIVFTPEKVTYWLNGKKTVEFVPWSEDWEKRKSGGKWKDYSDYGKSRSGLVGLQDHGSFIWFKNIKIRKL